MITGEDFYMIINYISPSIASPSFFCLFPPFPPSLPELTYFCSTQQNTCTYLETVSHHLVVSLGFSSDRAALPPSLFFPTVISKAYLVSQQQLLLDPGLPHLPHPPTPLPPSADCSGAHPYPLLPPSQSSTTNHPPVTYRPLVEGPWCFAY